VTLGPMTLKRALTSDETQSIVNGSHAIYMMGEIRYIDAFKHARTTRFRLLHRGNGKPQYNTVSTIHDAEGNDSD